MCEVFYVHFFPSQAYNVDVVLNVLADEETEGQRSVTF